MKTLFKKAQEFFNKHKSYLKIAGIVLLSATVLIAVNKYSKLLKQKQSLESVLKQKETSFLTSDNKLGKQIRVAEIYKKDLRKANRKNTELRNDYENRLAKVYRELKNLKVKFNNVNSYADISTEVKDNFRLTFEPHYIDTVYLGQIASFDDGFMAETIIVHPDLKGVDVEYVYRDSLVIVDELTRRLTKKGNVPFWLIRWTYGKESNLKVVSKNDNCSISIQEFIKQKK